MRRRPEKDARRGTIFIRLAILLAGALALALGLLDVGAASPALLGLAAALVGAFTVCCAAREGVG